MTWFGDPEIDAAMRGEDVSATRPVAVVAEVTPRLMVVNGDLDGIVLMAMQPPKLQLIFDSPNGVRPVHQLFQGATVDPDIDPWADQNNTPPTGEVATMTRFGG